MDEVRMVTLDCLLRRLEDVLGSDSLLYHRFQHGLRREDERCLAGAMDSLRLYPEGVRRLVEDAVMSWLFGAHSDAPTSPREARPHG